VGGGIIFCASASGKLAVLVLLHTWVLAHKQHACCSPRCCKRMHACVVCQETMPTGPASMPPWARQLLWLARCEKTEYSLCCRCFAAPLLRPSFLPAEAHCCARQLHRPGGSAAPLSGAGGVPGGGCGAQGHSGWTRGSGHRGEAPTAHMCIVLSSGCVHITCWLCMMWLGSWG
jgi:hypothetical protein